MESKHSERMNNKRILDLYLHGKLGGVLHVKTDQIGSFSCALDARANPLTKGYSSFFIGMEIESPLSQFSRSRKTLLSIMNCLHFSPRKVYLRNICRTIC